MIVSFLVKLLVEVMYKMSVLTVLVFIAVIVVSAILVPVEIVEAVG